MSGSIISSTITTGVTLGYGTGPLSITSAGKISAADYGILIPDVAGGTVVNSGSVIGSTDGIYLSQSQATIINQGFMAGNVGIEISNFSPGEALVVNSGTLRGNIGVAGVAAAVSNTGTIYGSNVGLKLHLSTVTNSGTITGGEGVYLEDGTLTNAKAILAQSVGVDISGGYAKNSGTIIGTVSTGARVEDEVGAGTTLTGSLVNYGSISGGIYGVNASGVFSNHGGVSGRIGLAVGVGGSAANAGAIYGSAYGAELLGKTSQLGGASLANQGTIAGGAIGVTVAANGNLYNAGYIYGPKFGVAVYNGYVSNSGTIRNAAIGVTLSGSTAVGVNHGTIAGLDIGLTLSGGLAENYGTISGGGTGVVISGGSLANFGRISGSRYAVSDTGASVTNYGLISAQSYGMQISHGVVTNAGTIAGALGAIEGSAITLAVEPGAVFVGGVANSSGKGELDLAGAGLGSLSGIGTQFTGFKVISFASGPQWSIEGNDAGFGSGVTIAGFAQGDTIVLDGFSASSDSYVKNAGLELANANGAVTLDITGNFTTGSFRVTESGSTTTIVNVTCFARGTRIATPDGEVAVEALRIGDPVMTLHGGVRRVKWVGRRSYDGRFIRGNKAALPVRITAGAIADGVPARDLRVSPGHAIFIDGALVHAGRLVNGVSVLQEEVDEVTYFHVELDEHEILLAENCPAESFMDEHFRQQFQNAAEYARLYPGHAAPRTMCHGRLDSGFALQAIRNRLDARAGLQAPGGGGALRGCVDAAGPVTCFGWAQDEAAPEMPVCLDIMGGGRRIGRVLANLYRADVAAAGYGSGYQGFEFTLPAGIAGAIEVVRAQDGARLATAAADRAA